MSVRLLNAVFAKRGFGAFSQNCRLISLSSQSPLQSEAKHGENFFDKNKRLNRPMSPHLTIYKFQITSVLSITHRATGLALSGLTSGFAIGMLMLPGSFPHYYTMLQASTYGGGCIFAAKFMLAMPFMFHFANGIRHLAWDLGKGFQIKSVYASGYGVLAATLLGSIIAASM